MADVTAGMDGDAHVGGIITIGTEILERPTSLTLQ
jgi:hypothetical protein